MTPQAPARVAVILVNWNGWRDTIECLDSLLACDYAAFEVYVVDNDSTDGSLEHIAQWCVDVKPNQAWRDFPGVRRLSRTTDARVDLQWHDSSASANPDLATPVRQVHLIRSGANLGFAGGNNVGMRAAGFDRFEFFWLLNTDTIVDRGALGHLVDRAMADVKIGMVGSTLRYYHEPTKVQAMGGAQFDPLSTSMRHIGIGAAAADCPAAPAAVEARMDYVVGASMLVRSAFVREVGYMQEDYFLYFEELDWATRGRGRFSLAYAPLSHVYHKVGASSAAVASTRSLEYLYRSRLRYMRRFMIDKLPQTRRNMLRHAIGYARRGRFEHALLVLRIWLESRRADALDSKT